MEKECCSVKVTETDDGLRIDIKGEGLKEKCETVFKNCCSEDMKKSGFQFCCGPGK